VKVPPRLRNAAPGHQLTVQDRLQIDYSGLPPELQGGS